MNGWLLPFFAHLGTEQVVRDVYLLGPGASISTWPWLSSQYASFGPAWALILLIRFGGAFAFQENKCTLDIMSNPSISNMVAFRPLVMGELDSLLRKLALWVMGMCCFGKIRLKARFTGTCSHDILLPTLTKRLNTLKVKLNNILLLHIVIV